MSITMAYNHSGIFIALILFGIVGFTHSAKILLVPFNHGSHVNFFSIAGESLQAAGHDVYSVVTTKYEKMARDHNIKPIIPNIKTPNRVFEDHVEKGDMSPLVVFPAMFNVTKVQLREMMEDKEFIGQLENLKFDLLIMDGVDFCRCNYVLPYKLSVPFITITARQDPWTFRVPALPSVEGQIPLYIMTEESTIIQRVMNTIVFMLSMVFVPPSPFAIADDSLIGEYVPDKENIGFANLFHQSEMVLVNVDMICLDFHKVSSPYYQFIGGLGAKDAKPLPKEFDEIMKKSLNGVIILTFGSGLKIIPAEILNKMLDAFRDIKQTVIMRHSGKSKVDVPSNVHMMSWLPQNDLLGHPKTKLFITHVGNNGQLEGVYHGVPMLMMPMFGDQFYNTRRGVLRGYGKELNSKTFTTQQFKETVTELIENKTYSDNIKKCSRIVHSLPKPQEQVLFWVNHILEFGGSHLRPFYLDMPLWKFFMLDVLLVFLLVALFIYYILKLCYVKCCFKRGKHHEKLE